MAETVCTVTAKARGSRYGATEVPGMSSIKSSLRASAQGSDPITGSTVHVRFKID